MSIESSSGSGDHHHGHNIKVSREQIITLDVDRDESVENLKALLDVETRVPLQQQQLLYDGKEMRNSEKLSRIGVNDGDLMMLVANTRPTSSHLRQLFQVDPADYMLAICGNDALRELSSPGKSGSFFYLTQDDRFMIKTVKKSEVKVLIKMLRGYHDHVCRYENSLVTKFYGRGHQPHPERVDARRSSQIRHRLRIIKRKRYLQSAEYCRCRCRCDFDVIGMDFPAELCVAVSDADSMAAPIPLETVGEHEWISVPNRPVVRLAQRPQLQHHPRPARRRRRHHLRPRVEQRHLLCLHSQRSPDWLVDDSTYLGQRQVDGFLCNVWTKADFIWNYEDVVTKRPVF